MNDESLTYRFRSTELSGQIEVEAGLVRAKLRKGFTRSEFITPLEQLHPHPIRISKVPSDCWICLVLGVLALLMFAFAMLDSKAPGFGGIRFFLANRFGGRDANGDRVLVSQRAVGRVQVSGWGL